MWNETTATLAFSVTPAYYQTAWFRALCIVLAAALVWGAHRWRVRLLRDRFEMSLDARVAERTRIARELHDPLLQSFHGLLLRFQTASHLLPDRPAEAKAKLDDAIDLTAQAVTEGRDAVHGLRTPTLQHEDFARAIRTVGDDLAHQTGADPPASFDVVVEGAPRDVQPIVRDEIYRIVVEALRNAFRHAKARRIEVEIRYAEEQLRVRVRDDGTGIDPAVLARAGVEGHYGLRGMPERAAAIGGQLSMWSDAGAGTEVELRLPGSAAYPSARRRRFWRSG